MAKRRRLPDRARPGNRADALANVAAWLILFAGLVYFAHTVWTTTATDGAVEVAAERPEPLAIPPRAATPLPVVTASPVPSPSPSRSPSSAERQPTTPAPPAARDLLARSAATHPAIRGPAATRSPRVAIIIDDVGHDLARTRRAMRIPYHLTFAIIPHLEHSQGSAKLLHANGFEVMLHLPMEPLAYPSQDPGEGAVLMRMADSEIRRTVFASLAAVPFVSGVNNHMGSRLTSDRRSMRVVLEALATTPYFFIDSKTADSSVAMPLCRELRIPSAERSVFLDDTASGTAIRKQLRLLERIAREQGSAIAIGHPHEITLDTLARELPRMSRSGIRIVFASELVSV